MIEFDHVTMTYDGAREPALRDVSFTVPEGELALVIGRTGSGKSTLLRAINGLVPHFTGGTLAGRVLVDGRDTREYRPRDLADVVGMVGQDPMAGFVTDTVEDELAYSMESLGVAPDVMRRRVEETLDLLGLADVRERALTSLSGGQRQRTAIGAALTSHPAILVLDEPTSALDPQAAEEVLAALQRLVHDLGVTVVMAEHRLERVIQYADRVIEVPGRAAAVSTGLPAERMVTAPVAPPVVELGRLAGWSPLPLSVRDARRAAVVLRSELGSTAPARTAAALGAELARCTDLVVGYGAVTALRGVSLSLKAGEIVALMGRNGAGKSTLLNALVGILPARSGSATASGADPRRTKPSDLVKAVGLVPQEPADLLYAATVADECATADSDFGVPAGSCRALLERLAPDVPLDAHPRDLSEGQRLCLALAVVLCGAPPLLLLDEPTRGLDYGAKRRLVAILRELSAAGHAVVLSTHDERIFDVASRRLHIEDGRCFEVPIHYH